MNSKTLTQKYIALCLLIFLFFCFAVTKRSLGYDTNIFRDWVTYIFVNGLGNTYKAGVNYLPVYPYFMYLFGKMQGSTENIATNFHYLKLFALIAQFFTGYFLVLLLKPYHRSVEHLLFNSLFYLLNIAVLYNAMLWGQVDEFMACFCFGSFYFAYKKRITLSLVFLVLAVNFKLQSIIFLPFIGLLLLPQMIANFTFKRMAAWLLFPFLLQFLLVLPFLLTGTLGLLWEVITGSMGRFHLVSIKAFNIWYLLLEGDPKILDDRTTAFGLSYNLWGLIAFFVSSFFALFPLFWNGVQQVFRKQTAAFPLDKLLLTGALIPLLFFFFNTQMHDRYAHVFLVFITSYAILSRNVLPALIGCLAYLLNLENVLKFLRLPNYETVIFDPIFIALLFLLTIILLYGYLYGILKSPRNSFSSIAISSEKPPTSSNLMHLGNSNEIHQAKA